VWYECEYCRARLEEGHRMLLLRSGEWRPRVPERSSERRSYHLSALYATPGGKVSWRGIVTDFLRVKDISDRLRVWVNQTLGEPFVEKGEAPPWEKVHERAEPYPIGTVPAGGVVLTAGIDVQQDRLELEVVAWGPRMESWSVAYEVIVGETAGEAVWQQLDHLLARPYRMASGVDARVRLAGIDSGFIPQTVYSWARLRPLRVAVLKGQDAIGVLVGVPTLVDVTLGGRKLRRGVRLWPVGGAVAKRDLYSALRLPRPKPGQPFPPGYSHFPGYSEAHFQGLCSEQLTPTPNKRGYTVYRWTKIHERNEQLDCRVYARAAAAILGLDRYTAGDWARAAAGAVAPPAAPGPAPAAGQRFGRAGRLFDRWRSPPNS
jgi:phage terminase large subunit GpA-like protein